MADIIIKGGAVQEEKKPVQDNEIKEFLIKENELQKLKDINLQLEAEINKNEELKARMAVGGRALAGQVTPEKTPQDIAKEEAERILKIFR